jgi:hypothetical protein
MQETQGNSFDTTTPEGRMKEIRTLLGLKYATPNHEEKFLDGYWQGLGGHTPRMLVERSEEGFMRIKSLITNLSRGEYPERFVRSALDTGIKL